MLNDLLKLQIFKFQLAITSPLTQLFILKKEYMQYLFKLYI
jgi:hypothetical protein